MISNTGVTQGGHLSLPFTPYSSRSSNNGVRRWGVKGQHSGQWLCRATRPSIARCPSASGSGGQLLCGPQWCSFPFTNMLHWNEFPSAAGIQSNPFLIICVCCINEKRPEQTSAEGNPGPETTADRLPSQFHSLFHSCVFSSTFDSGSMRHMINTGPRIMISIPENQRQGSGADEPLVQRGLEVCCTTVRQTEIW